MGLNQDTMKKAPDSPKKAKSIAVTFETATPILDQIIVEKYFGIPKEKIVLLPVSVGQHYWRGPELQEIFRQVNAKNEEFSKCLILIGDHLTFENMKALLHVKEQKLQEYINKRLKNTKSIDSTIKAIVDELSQNNKTIKTYSNQIVTEFSKSWKHDSQFNCENITATFKAVFESIAHYAACKSGLDWLKQNASQILSLDVPFSIMFWDETIDSKFHVDSSDFVENLLRGISSNEDLKSLISDAAVQFTTSFCNNQKKSHPHLSSSLVLPSSNAYIEAEIKSFDAFSNLLAENPITDDIKALEVNIQNDYSQEKFDASSMDKLKLIAKSNPVVYDAITGEHPIKSVVDVINKAKCRSSIEGAEIVFQYPFKYFNVSQNVVHAIKLVKNLRYLQTGTFEDKNLLSFAHTVISSLNYHSNSNANSASSDSGSDSSEEEKETSTNNSSTPPTDIPNGNTGKFEVSNNNSTSVSPTRRNTDEPTLEQLQQSAHEDIKEVIVQLSSENLTPPKSIQHEEQSVMLKATNTNDNFQTQNINQLNNNIGQPQQKQPVQSPTYTDHISPASSILVTLNQITSLNQNFQDPVWAGTFIGTLLVTLESASAKKPYGGQAPSSNMSSNIIQGLINNSNILSSPPTVAKNPVNESISNVSPILPNPVKLDSPQSQMPSQQTVISSFSLAPN